MRGLKRPLKRLNSKPHAIRFLEEVVVGLLHSVPHVLERIDLLVGLIDDTFQSLGFTPLLICLIFLKVEVKLEDVELLLQVHHLVLGRASSPF